ncbi:abortive infection family protein [Microbispora hainanensis]|uniref:abortive infection family protein n=1 Tax=Microbispora hainanensis TaxID=568844 RepID=UPI00324609AE
MTHAICDYLCEEYGRVRLSDHQSKLPTMDLIAFVQKCSTPELMDVISAAIHVLQMSSKQSFAGHDALNEFTGTVRVRMREHKLAYDLIDNRIVEMGSDHLHQNVTIPAVTLLHGRSRFKAAEEQYRAAFDELSQGNWADSITDANAAVEIVLREIVGYEQGQLPDLLGAARKLGIFGSPQEARLKRLTQGLEALSDIRNRESDAHGNKADKETAWLAVHWAGALIVFLVQRAEAIGK